MFRRVNPGELLAASGGVALLFSMFLNWYEVDVSGGRVRGASAFATQDAGLSAWQAFAWIDLLLLAAVALGVAQALYRIFGVMPVLPLPPGALVGGVGAIGAMLVVYRLAAPPIESTHAFGFVIEVTRRPAAYLGLAAACGIAAGGLLSASQPSRGGVPAPR